MNLVVLAHVRLAQARVHHVPKGASDRFALVFTRLPRWLTDTFLTKRYGHRAIVL